MELRARRLHHYLHVGRDGVDAASVVIVRG